MLRLHAACRPAAVYLNLYLSISPSCMGELNIHLNFNRTYTEPTRLSASTVPIMQKLQDRIFLQVLTYLPAAATHT